MKKLIFVSLLSTTLFGCASVREWTLPMQGIVKKTPEALAGCIQNAFAEHKINYDAKFNQRLTRSASGEIVWDQLDTANVILHRVVLSQALDKDSSNYRVDAVSIVGLHGLGKIDVCFK